MGKKTYVYEVKKSESFLSDFLWGPTKELKEIHEEVGNRIYVYEVKPGLFGISKELKEIRQRT